jgi:uncharacterized protein YcbX
MSFLCLWNISDASLWHELSKARIAGASITPRAAQFQAPRGACLCSRRRWRGNAGSYQADWLSRFFGFEVQQLTAPDKPNSPLSPDGKPHGLQHPEHCPLDLHRPLAIRALTGKEF